MPFRLQTLSFSFDIFSGVRWVNLLLIKQLTVLHKWLKGIYCWEKIIVWSWRKQFICSVVFHGFAYECNFPQDKVVETLEAWARTHTHTVVCFVLCLTLCSCDRCSFYSHRQIPVSYLCSLKSFSLTCFHRIGKIQDWALIFKGHSTCHPVAFLSLLLMSTRGTSDSHQGNPVWESPISAPLAVVDEG